MGTSDDFKTLLGGCKVFAQGLNYSRIRASRRSVSSLSNSDLQKVLFSYSLQYVEDCKKDTFYLPLSCANNRYSESFILDFLIVEKIVGKTYQEAICKAMTIGYQEPQRLYAVFVGNNPPFYVSRDFIFDSAGDMLFGMFIKCVNDGYGRRKIENTVVHVSSKVYTNPTDLNKAILKYMVTNAMYTPRYTTLEYRRCRENEDEEEVLPTIMQVSEIRSELMRVPAPSTDFDNKEVKRVLLENLDYFV